MLDTTIVFGVGWENLYKLQGQPIVGTSGFLDPYLESEPRFVSEFVRNDQH